jgi:hypothetical protein
MENQLSRSVTWTLQLILERLVAHYGFDTLGD